VPSSSSSCTVDEETLFLRLVILANQLASNMSCSHAVSCAALAAAARVPPVLLAVLPPPLPLLDPKFSRSIARNRLSRM
jgi:hypothetical protein